jgi:hypothetical protein
VSISPNVGTKGGTTIVADIPGITVSDTVDIRDTNGRTICLNIRIVSYGVVECDTKKQDYSSTLLRLYYNNEYLDCVNS